MTSPSIWEDCSSKLFQMIFRKDYQVHLFPPHTAIGQLRLVFFQPCYFVSGSNPGTSPFSEGIQTSHPF